MHDLRSMLPLKYASSKYALSSAVATAIPKIWPAQVTAIGYVSIVTVACFSTSEASCESEIADMMNSHSQGKARIAGNDQDREARQ